MDDEAQISGKSDYQGCKRARRNFRRREESSLLELQPPLRRNLKKFRDNFENVMRGNQCELD